LGTYTKDEIRALAAKLGLANAAQPESQDICFIPEGDYAGFIDSYLAQTDPSALPKPGRILTTSGAPVGAHEGIHHFTTGQRRGLGVAGPEPYYVLDLDPKAATVIIGTKAERGSRTASLDALNILDPVELANGQLVSARHRYQGTEHPAKVFVQNSNTARIEFIEQQPDLTKGQALVLYKEDRVIGGGTIVAYA
jgi:tRNA-specific 2-thiouridylase